MARRKRPVGDNINKSNLNAGSNTNNSNNKDDGPSNLRSRPNSHRNNGLNSSHSGGSSSGGSSSGGGGVTSSSTSSGLNLRGNNPAVIVGNMVAGGITGTVSFNAKEQRKKSALNLLSGIGCLCLIVASYFCYLGYLETRVNTPFDVRKMVQSPSIADSERYWGSYRPLNYFGMKTRDPHSLVMGLMWYSPKNLGHGGKGIRHWCDLSDNLDKYGWIQHDGRSFGVQEIHDYPFELKTSFVKFSADRKFGGDWTARISVRNTTAEDRSISLIWYVALDDRTVGHIKYVSETSRPESSVHGETQGLGKFQVRFHPIKGRILHKSYLSTRAQSLSKLKETIFTHFRVFPNKRGNGFIGLPGEIVSQSSKGYLDDPNFIAIQITTEADFSLDITYQSTSGYSIAKVIPKPTIAQEYTAVLQEKIIEFDRRFENTFQLQSKGFAPAEIKFAKNALSNMIGGIGYFYGASRVKSVHTKSPVPYWKAGLYTAVPSRAFFPRGFLWDEGFHGLLISSWDIDIELDIICHWFDLLNVEGWIPREQILGIEALAKVPEDFVIQHNTNGNPPTFFLTLNKLLNHHRKELSINGRLAVLERLYPRLQAWFAWYNSTQRGDILGTYQWRGRDATTERELNPKTLTSGLDDFPRASHPTNNERHIDLRCWIAFASSVMSELSTILGKNDNKYYETASYLTDNRLLNDQHLSPFTETYTDWGLHTDSVVLKRQQINQKNLQQKSHQYHSQLQHQQQLEMVRVTIEKPDYKFIDSTYGYVNLFPFMLELLDNDSPYLEKTLRDMRDPLLLWTNYGLRSLAKSSPLYLKRNTEHDPPYWRGPIWININYLVLKALRHYGKMEGPYANLSREIYNELRENIIRNMFKEYQRTGYIWEQYDDSTGYGKGCNPFTGWSALVVSIMSEQY